MSKKGRKPAQSISKYAPLLSNLKEAEDAATDIETAWVKAGRKLAFKYERTGKYFIIPDDLRALQWQLMGAIEKSLACLLPPSIPFEFLERRLRGIERRYMAIIQLEREVPSCDLLGPLINQVDSIVREDSSPAAEDRGTTDKVKKKVKKADLTTHQRDCVTRWEDWQKFKICFSEKHGREADLADYSKSCKESVTKLRHDTKYAQKLINDRFEITDLKRQ